MRHLMSNMVYGLFVRPWLRLIIGVNFKNAEALEEADHFIIVANHNSHFDTVSIMASLPAHMRNYTRATAAADYFGKTPFIRKLMFFFFNAIFIRREPVEGEKPTLEILDDELKNGKSLIIFPEGTRGKPGVIKDFKHGIAVLLKGNPEVPFIPVYLDGFGRVLPKDAWLIVPLICTVRFGDPVYPKGQSVDAILTEVKEAIINLKNKDERDYNNFKFE